MRIIISGKPGSGKSTIARLLAERLKIPHFSSGDFMRDMASEKGISLKELGSIAEKDATIDHEIDERQKKLAAKTRHFVIDSRLGAYFIEDVFKIFLDASPEVRAKRIFSDKRSTESYDSFQKLMSDMILREESENKRYLKYYNIDNSDLSPYDLIIDTSRLDPEDVVGKILVALDADSP